MLAMFVIQPEPRSIANNPVKNNHITVPQL